MDLRSIITSTNSGLMQSILVLGNCQIVHIHGHNTSKQNNSLFTCLNSHQENERKFYQLNLYPIISLASYKSQFWIWHFWSPYFCRPHFAAYTICSINLFASWWSCEVVWWLISVFSRIFWDSPWNFVPWSMKTLIGAPNLLSTLSKNAYAIHSLLQFGNGTNPTTWKVFSHDQNILVMSHF